MACHSDSMQNINLALTEMFTEKLIHTHLTALQTVTKALRDEQFRASVEGDFIGNLFAVLSRLSVDIQHLSDGEDLLEKDVSLCLKLTAECFRAHRNACVQCTQNQCSLRDLGSIKVSFEILCKLLKLSSGSSNDIYDALRCGIQFLGNIAVGNQLCKDDIWELGFPHIFRDLLELLDEKAVSYTCMVLHTCLDKCKTEQLAKDGQQLKVSLKIMDLCRTFPDVDWTVLIATQHFLKSSELIGKMYSEMTNEERLTLLELILAQLGVGEEEKESLIPLSAAQFLASCFNSHCRAVLSLSSQSSADDQAAMVVIRLLDILCEMTSGRKKFMALQDHSDLLSSTVDLLKEVHLLGKTSKNVFTVAHDFSLTRPGGADTHPVLSFKAHLIRLIGNLCHGHIVNQDKVRELDGIALILDNCSIDSNNPFISQWAVFAIRILLEHNPENQTLIQGLRRQGVADDTMLREMGFRVEERDGSLLLRPLQKDP
ncbi:ataxin-10-like [Myxocyprinus asiaticus]|uniref:ataxin-10-like n=1 Tax=Myxocyprinus asiaticus TaxID=70543 RepID=UPI002221D42C|nr:ataxin-10-like [Myxocyprinus asiaticus]